MNNEKSEMEKQMKAMVEAERREAQAISQATEDELTKGSTDPREIAQRLHVRIKKMFILIIVIIVRMVYIFFT